MKEYKIEEFNGKFTILLEVEETKGILWWRQKVSYWRKCDDSGNKAISFKHIHTVMSPLQSLEEAKEQVKRWNKGVIYHKI